VKINFDTQSPQNIILQILQGKREFYMDYSLGDPMRVHHAFAENVPMFAEPKNVYMAYDELFACVSVKKADGCSWIDDPHWIKDLKTHKSLLELYALWKADGVNIAHLILHDREAYCLFATQALKTIEKEIIAKLKRI
jgi:hypothetical protein